MNRYRLKYLLTKWFKWSEWSYQIRYRFWGMFQRAHHGWAPKDTWSFDNHLSRIIGGGLRHLAANTHGCPMSFVKRYGDEKCHKMWQIWLEETAWWFEQYNEEFGLFKEHKSKAAQKVATKVYERDRKTFHEKILPDFCKHFGSLWD